MNNLEKVKERLHKTGASLVVFDGVNYQEYYNKGIKDILEILKQDANALKGKTIGDKVIGKVAGSILVVAGVKEIYADTISELIIPILEERKVSYQYNQKVEYIQNRDQTGMCPMEQRFKEVTEIEKIYEELVK